MNGDIALRLRDLVKKYIEDHNEEDSAFQIWDQKKDLSASGEPLGA
jgi:hypothetical protein